MHLLIATLVSGVVAFAATTIDDLLILALLFSDKTLRPRHIVAGQFLGFAVLIGGSLVGAFLALVVPQHWIGLLGLLPIYMGVRHAVRPRHDVRAEAPREEPSALRSLLDAQTYKVAAITVADGGDNFGIYIPLFASAGLGRSLMLAGLFLALVGVLCFVGLALARHPVVGRWLDRIGHRLAPVVLVALGVYILISNGTVRWLAHL